MDQVLDQLRFHPWTAILGCLAWIACLVFLLRKSGPKPPTAIAGLALFAASLGLAVSVDGVVDTFHGIALIGSGGQGTVSAGFAEAIGALLLGLFFAALILASGLLLLRGTPAGDDAPPSRPTALLLLAVTALAGLAVAAVSAYQLRFVASIREVLTHPPTGSMASVSQGIADHINRLRFLSLGSVLASLALIVLTFLLPGARRPSSGQILWGRVLLGLFLLLVLAGLFVVWGRFTAFEMGAMIGKLP
jgi:hypothetical protein